MERLFAAGVFHPRVVKGVHAISSRILRAPNGGQTIAALIGVGIAAKLQPENWTAMRNVGARLKRITIAFTSWQAIAYDKLNPIERANYIPPNLQGGGENLVHVNEFIDMNATQRMAGIEARFQRLPYEKLGSSVVTFSFSGMSASEDYFVCFPSTNVDLDIQVEFQAHFEYPRSSKAGTLLKRGINNQDPTRSQKMSYKRKPKYSNKKKKTYKRKYKKHR